MPPISYIGRGGPNSGGAIRLTVSQADLDRAIKYLSRYQGAYAQKYVHKVMYAAAKIPVSRMKAVLPRQSGNLQKSVKARQNRLRIKEMGAATVGPTAPHRQLYIVGSKPHSLEGGTSKYRARTGKGKWSVFPDRGKQYRLKKVRFTGPMKGAQAHTGMAYIAYNPWLQHRGSKPHGQLDLVFNTNKPKISAFVQGEVAKMGQGGFTGIGINLP